MNEEEKNMKNIELLLQKLNETLLATHTGYEDLFWTSYMGDHSVNDKMLAASNAVNAFRADRDLSAQVDAALMNAEEPVREKLLQWQTFFSCYQTPQQFLSLRDKIAELETSLGKVRASRTEGYVDPHTNKFVETSRGKMRMMTAVDDDEAIRKACFESVNEMATLDVEPLIELVNLRNEYARGLGDEDFYAYKLRIGEGITKTELFALCDEIYNRTKYGFENIREMEKEMPGLRLPWNYSYMLSGNLTAEEYPYMQFSDALLRWGRSFSALGIDYQGATLQLDLIDREGKYNNGFCHWPELVHFKNDKRVPGKCNFTANAVPGQIGAGSTAFKTLFHEGGHAAHLTNVETSETCMNHEYAPLSAAWAETHSMFLDTMQGSVEWLMRYAENNSGEKYPFELYERAVRQLHPVQPLDFMRFLEVIDFERELYSTPNLTKEMVLNMARRVNKKYKNYEIDTFYVLGVPHIYSWESACMYQGYALATLAVSQWREYFYKKYASIVDNPEVSREMYDVWKLGSSKTFAEFVTLATGKKLSADAYLSKITGDVEDQLSTARAHVSTLESVPEQTGPVELNAVIRMVHGKDVVADNAKGFEAMAEEYRSWLSAKEAS